jgi:hypothetical protein
MPCCAFAACIVAQIILGVSAVKRALFGSGVESPERNPAVEWRLDSPPAPSLDLAAGRLPRRRSLRVLALAAAVELVIIVAGIYGVVEHFGHGHGGEHAAHAQRGDGMTQKPIEAHGAHD